MELRAATTADLPQILAIYNEAVLNTTASYDYLPQSLADRQAWFDSKVAQQLPVLVMADSMLILGFASYGPFRSWEGYRYTVEHSLYVHQNHRQQGIGKALLSALINQAEAQALHVMVAGIDADNQVSIRLHEQFGFVPAGTIQQVGFKFNRWLDLCLMQRILTPAIRWS
jgi:L-amino acid N-acyltransferase YncA